MPKPKRVNKSKEQILTELKSNRKFQEKLSFVRDEFYPALIKATDNVESAGQFLSSTNSFLMESFLGFMKEKTFKELNLAEKLSPIDPHYEDLKALMGLLDDKNVFDAKDILEGVRGEIELFKQDMFKKMRLEDLKTKWLDEI